MKPNRILTASLVASSVLFALSAEGRTLIQSKGSDTLVNVAQAWAEAYPSVNPEVAVSVTGGGSGVGIAALINGTTDIANSSRAMEDKEIALAKSKGHDPKQTTVGYDALAVFVYKDNPVKSLSIPQLAEIYGDEGKYETWTQLGIEVPGCQGQKIVRVSRQNNSGTYKSFQEHVMGKKRDYKLGSLDVNGSKDVVDLVEKTPCAIGYSGLAYETPAIKKVCIAKTEGATCALPTVQTAIDGSYPIARPLYMYTSGEPQGAVKTYIDWILSDAGQCIVLNTGYAPLRDVKGCKK